MHTCNCIDEGIVKKDIPVFILLERFPISVDNTALLYARLKLNQVSKKGSLMNMF